MLVGVTEGMLPFKLEDKNKGGTSAGSLGGSSIEHESANDDIATRLQEERRLMYVGITRAQRSLAVSWTKRRKKGREMIIRAAQPLHCRDGVWIKPPSKKTRVKNSKHCGLSLRRKL